MTSTAVDFEAIKDKQRAGWQTGDYPRVGNTLQIIAELLVEAADVRAGQRALDVACGQGNAALAAARRFADATGIDYATNLLEQGRERAAAEHLPVTFTEGDAENLPVPDASFDLVLSTVGVMFAPDHQRAADELVRVTKPGGKIALSCWTPSGMVGQMFKVGRQVGAAAGRGASPPCCGAPRSTWPNCSATGSSGRRWRSASTCSATTRPEHFSEWFREFYGPITKLAGLCRRRTARSSRPNWPTYRAASTRPTTARSRRRAEYLEAVGVRR